MDVSDSDLLALYTREGDEDAFATVVKRHLSMVYSAALRQVRIPALAEEVSQVVFLELARAGGKIGSEVRVSNWLYKVTHRRAVDLLRRETSRQSREAGALILAQNETESDWDPLEECLDAALIELPPLDRAAVILRYIEGQSLIEVGRALGTSENAAQKRVGRALDVLRARLESQGVRVGVRGLILVLSKSAANFAPSTLVGSILSAASAASATPLSAVTVLPFSVMTIKKSILTGTVVILAGVAVYLALESSRLRQELEGLRNQVEIADSTKRRNETTALPVDDRELEILRLRGEVARLMREIAQSRTNNTNASQVAGVAAPIPEDFTAPTATIEASLQRLMKVAQFNDIERIRPFITWKIDEAVPAKFVEGITDAYPRSILDTFGPNGSAAGIQILDHWEEATGVVRARVEATGRDGQKHALEMRFASENGDWKPVITIEQSPAGSTSTTLFLPRSREPDAP